MTNSEAKTSELNLKSEDKEYLYCNKFCGFFTNKREILDKHKCKNVFREVFGVE